MKMARFLRVLVFLLFTAALALPIWTSRTVEGQAATEAPTGFDTLTNGLVTQAVHDTDRATFEESDDVAKGLGPLYNAQSCAECHQNPVTGGISQITELRAGHFNGTNFVDQPGGSLNNDRAVSPELQERVPGGNEVRTFRTSLNTQGDGFVEAIDSNTLVAISNGQPSNMRGQFIQVPVLEAPDKYAALALAGRINRQASSRFPAMLIST